MRSNGAFKIGPRGRGGGVILCGLRYSCSHVLSSRVSNWTTRLVQTEAAKNVSAVCSVRMVARLSVPPLCSKEGQERRMNWRRFLTKCRPLPLAPERRPSEYPRKGSPSRYVWPKPGCGCCCNRCGVMFVGVAGAITIAAVAVSCAAARPDGITCGTAHGANPFPVRGTEVQHPTICQRLSCFCFFWGYVNG